MSQVEDYPGVVQCCPPAQGGPGSTGGVGGPCQGQGMAAQPAINAFGNDMATLQKDWGTLTPAARTARLQSLVDAQATRNNFPAPRITTPRDLGAGRNGELRFSGWQVAISPGLMNASTLSRQQAEQLGDTLYHETRHAEQWFLMARRDADGGLTADQIQSQLSVPPRVAQAAVANPIPATDARRGCADAMYNSVYGTNAAARNATLGDLGTKSASLALANQALAQATAARNTLAASPGTTAQALANANNLVNSTYATVTGQYNSFQTTYAAYRALPEEADAWNAGTRAAAAVKSAFAPTGP